MALLNKGDKAPDFKGKDQDENFISLSDLQGKKVVLYFYPKDNTPGCTAEACNLRDNYNELTELGYEVIGVSPDGEKSHTNFISKYELPFKLIADTEKEILKAYGAWGTKKMYGKTYEGVLRTTYIIDENGYILTVFDKVKTKDHTKQILAEMETA